MNDCLVVYIERDVICNIDNEIIMQQFQNMKTRKKKIVNFMYLHVFLLLLSIYKFLFLLDCIIFTS